MTPTRMLFLLGAIGVLANSLNARLDFAETTRRLAGDAAGEEVLRTEFSFVNRAERPVRIVEVKPECGCTSAPLEKTVYAPGEAGRIPVKFSVGALVGRSVKTITVTTDEPDENRYTLSLDVEITEWFSLSPRLLFWRPNEEPKPKELTIAVIDDRVKVAGVAVSGEGFEAAVKDTTDPKRAIVVVTPRTKKVGETAVLTIAFQLGVERRIQRQVYLRILPDASMPAPF